MSSEAITRNDLTAILNEVLPSAAVDYVVEQGTSGIWTYRKWASGIAECWGTASQNYSAATTWGTWYYIRDDRTPSYPTGLFIEAPVVNANLISAAGDYISSIRNGGTKDNAPTVLGVRPNSCVGGTGITSYYAVGKWK